MNDIFRQMAEQMKPSKDVVDDLARRLDAIDEQAKPRPAAPAPAAAPARARRRALTWVAAAACVAAAASAGVWAIGSQPVATTSSVEAPESVAGAGGEDARPGEVVLAPQLQAEPTVVPVKAYDDLYRVVATAMEGEHYYVLGDGLKAQRVPAPMPTGTRTETVDYSRTAGTADGSPYSATNVQVAGIDEGDIVKTDGRTLYVATGARVALLAPDGSSTRQIASIDTAAKDAPVAGAVLDMMLSRDKLVVFVQDYATATKIIGGNQPQAYVGYEATGTRAVLYNVADPANPRLIASLGQSGSYTTSRLSDGVLYLVTDYALTDPSKVRNDDPATFVPQLIDDGAAAPLLPDDIHALSQPQPRYTVVTAVDAATGARLGQQAVLAGADTTYMSQDNLYLATQPWDAKLSAAQRQAAGVGDVTGAATTIVRIALNDGELALGAQNTVPGTLLNQFTLDEHNGRLRVVTDYQVQWTQRVGLFVLDSKLKVVGKVPKLVDDESVQSVRFDGDVAYVVTFRQRDPLFAIDLSRPTKPTIMSALKIPGFSAYLHPWADGRLLGVGVDAKNDGTQTGLKLSMFDTGDPYEVTELTSKHVSGNDSEALADHKAVLVDPARGLIGFPVATWIAGSPPVRMHYAVYSYSADKGFTLAKNLNMDAAGAADATRGVLVGDYLYLCTSARVDVFAVDSLAKTAGVALDQ